MDQMSEEELLGTAMVVNNFEFGGSRNQYMVSELGTLGMTFRVYGHGDEISLWNSVWGFLMSQLQALMIFGESITGSSRALGSLSRHAAHDAAASPGASSAA